MSDASRFLESAITARPVARAEYRWQDLIGAMTAMIQSPPDPEVERTLLAVLRFEGTIRLGEGSEGPHSMSSEDMLRSIAIQALARWTGPAHLDEMRRVEAITSSSALRSIARAVIRQTEESKP